ncbi:MAG: tRNA (adenosine(37)-N6)-threonylcarbamoyltransferase complex ATPase subunit type 1 TsaE [Bacteroidetes bacterium GWF2_41_31]|jgi:tRNA threonylcarbamoyladenosine biosynthesis protein TsaE|nr:MAG: tRNA (adenosine(37)-N6)-threonylcarbamoyltransferase complex ATPase subunit type 1 TsaE [Bacteroidetes bacterium GWF2_41_31]PKP31062.1 MAG: tRNA (adenosine(37)-N6)-threonylcarbamoyltransferase complex ATPase subunit type 1 TsaE [Bacteroidetes bacterium HGW-Bacteroidetes-16]
METLVARSLDELSTIALKIIECKMEERVFAIKGKMGAGKTTLIKAFCDVLEVEDVVNSPTFALVNEYHTDKGSPVFHFDFYRVKKIEEVFDIGYEEYFFSNEYCFIEWPEMVRELLPESYVYINIEVGKNEERIIQFGCLNHP